MGTIELNQIRKRLLDVFSPHLDMSDWTNKDAAETERARLSRSLAAFALSELMGIDPVEACDNITDGFGDNGIDAIGLDSQAGVVVVIQAKWVDNGQKSPSASDVEKFTKGFRDLIAPRFERFNPKITAKKEQIINALDNPDVKFILALAYTGSQPLGTSARQSLDDLHTETNDVSEVVTIDILDQRRIHDFIRRGATRKAPNLTVTLHHWGMVDEPFRAFYGQVDATEVAHWWEEHGDSLFDRNLRKFIHDSSVNSAIEASVLQSPEHFWYFNNGVTVLCDEISKAPIGGASRKSGSFTFKGLTVVNGAQTVGSLGRAARQHPGSVVDARILARFISLQDVPPDFAVEVTRATNTQNRVERRDFVALDSQQERLRVDLKLEQGKLYAVKTGEPDPDPANGCIVVEATIALACSSSPDLAVQAKREIGRLWDDVSKAPYTTLFRSDLSATKMWNSVQVLRTVESTLKEKQKVLFGRDRAVAVHGNRLIAHLAFSQLDPVRLSTPEPVNLNEIHRMAETILNLMIEVISDNFEANYLASLFKNVTKSKEVVQLVTAKLAG